MASEPVSSGYAIGLAIAAQTRERLKREVAHGGMHFCRYGDCEVWVVDGGDHRCVLHSTAPWAQAARYEIAHRFWRLLGRLDDRQDAGINTADQAATVERVLRQACTEVTDGE